MSECTTKEKNDTLFFKRRYGIEKKIIKSMYQNTISIYKNHGCMTMFDEDEIKEIVEWFKKVGVYK